MRKGSNWMWYTTPKRLPCFKKNAWAVKLFLVSVWFQNFSLFSSTAPASVSHCSEHLQRTQGFQKQLATLADRHFIFKQLFGLFSKHHKFTQKTPPYSWSHPLQLLLYSTESEWIAFCCAVCSLCCFSFPFHLTTWFAEDAFLQTCPFPWQPITPIPSTGGH